MSNPIIKVCKIIESCETRGQLQVARHVALQCVKQVPDSAPLLWAYLRAAELNIKVDHYVRYS